MVLLHGVEFSLTWDNAKWKAMINATKDQLKASYDRMLVTSEVRRQFEFVLLQPRFRR